MAVVLVFARYRQNQLCLALHCTGHAPEVPPASGPVSMVSMFGLSRN